MQSGALFFCEGNAPTKRVSQYTRRLSAAIKNIAPGRVSLYSRGVEEIAALVGSAYTV